MPAKVYRERIAAHGISSPVSHPSAMVSAAIERKNARTAGRSDLASRELMVEVMVAMASETRRGRARRRSFQILAVLFFLLENHSRRRYRFGRYPDQKSGRIQSGR